MFRTGRQLKSGFNRWEAQHGKPAPIFGGRKQFSRRLSSSSGFTLVELLVVIAIVTILVAVLVPVFVVARNKANETVCLNNMKQIAAAAVLYTQDWDDTLPYAPGQAFASGYDPDPEALLTYPALRSVQRPSQSTYARFLLIQGTDGALKPENFRCPNDSGARAFNYHADTVYESALTSYLWDPASATAPNALPTPMEADPEPVNGVALGDLLEPSRARLFQDYGVAWHQQLRTEERQENGRTERLKQGYVNVAFADGHAKKVQSTYRERVVSRSGAAGGGAPDPHRTPVASPAP
ncbi:MAG: prepilin-type N-terminal cleavage/methylation domain-containing protein [Armatimonadetes bacterium]|nr:prepilin-type N-terminal cleavage/methylation domain-containing protein [Armatimonadota bacterium]